MQVINNLHAFIWSSMTDNNCNTYLIDGPTRVLIDPGHLKLFDHVENGLSELGITIEDIGLIICTHAHPDHMEAVTLFSKTSALVTLHYQEWQFLNTMRKQVKSYLGMGLDSFEPDFYLQSGKVSVNGVDLSIYHVPGHSPGSIAIYWPNHKVLFSGDLIFKDGLGRTDLPGGNGELLKKSIVSLKGLDVNCLLPGHGDIITGANDVKHNFDQLEQYWFNYI